MVVQIEVNDETREIIDRFSLEGETDDEVVRRMYSLAVKSQLRDFYSLRGTMPISEAIRRAKIEFDS